MVRDRDRKNPYAPSSTDGRDGSYQRPPGKFALTDALGSSGRSAVAPKKKKPSSSGGGDDKPETTDIPDDPAEMEAVGPVAEVTEDEPAPQAAAPEEAPTVSPAPVVPKLPRLDLGRRGGKP